MKNKMLTALLVTAAVMLAACGSLQPTTSQPTTSQSTITEFPLPADSYVPLGITTGPDGNLWFTVQNGNHIGRITPKGQITQFLLHPQDSNEKDSITAGPDGNLWFTEFKEIGRITPGK